MRTISAERGEITGRERKRERGWLEIREGRERERESPAVFPIRRRRPPHWVIYSPSSPSCPNFQPPPPPLCLLSFILSPLRLLSVGSLWTQLFRNDGRNTLRRAALLKWLTCEAEVLVSSHCYSSLFSVGVEEMLLLLRRQLRQHEASFTLKAAVNDASAHCPTLISVWHCSRHTSKDHPAPTNE